jgi:hypothetical protein
MISSQGNDPAVVEIQNDSLSQDGSRRQSPIKRVRENEHSGEREPLPVKAPVSRSRPGGLPYRRACFPDRPLAGPPLELDALAYAPVNELGVVFAFGMLARRLGFRVFSIQQDFPDCEAMYEVRPGIWQRVRIEFEFESRNFHRHRHHPDGCDVIVCWRHNWKECPPHLEVHRTQQARRPTLTPAPRRAGSRSSAPEFYCFAHQ